MSRWKLISEAGDGYRWVNGGDFRENLSQEAPVGDDGFIQDGNLSYRLPSMEDLLLQGRAKFMEDRSVRLATKFRTALGNPLSAKHSSLLKALSVDGENDYFDTYRAQSGGDGLGFSDSCFQTGSGKKVDISATGLIRAKQLLGLQNDAETDMSSKERANNLAVDVNSFGKESDVRAFDQIMLPQTQKHSFRPSPIKFHTAGGKSVSVSSDALKRAKSLLGDLELETSLCDANGENLLFSFTKPENLGNSSAIRTNDYIAHVNNEEVVSSKHIPKSFTCPLLPSRMPLQPSVNQHGDAQYPKSLVERHDELSSSSCKLSTMIGQDVIMGTKETVKVSGQPLRDISNIMTADLGIRKPQSLIEKRMLGYRSSSSPFKRPRNSRFSAPLGTGVPFANNAIEEPCLKRKVYARYPFSAPRTNIKKYFSIPPLQKIKADAVKEEIKQMNPMNAEKYKFHEESISCIGVEDFGKLLVLEGISMDCISQEWISNHYKWIVWKYACYERSYPKKFAGRLLTVSNVLEEMKYRYEREINYGHRSAIRKVLDGDVSPSSVMVLCISAINSALPFQSGIDPVQGATDINTVKLELTDGWYCIHAILDKLLLNQLASGKLYLGQKIRIWGARLCGWDGPILPLEEQRGAILMLHINGTYRAHWGDRLGLCKDGCIPLAFKCIKSAGGPIRQTIVGIKRIYPILFKERLSSGETIVMPEMLESKIAILLNERRTTVIERTTSEFGMSLKDFHSIIDCDEGARILKMLESSAEPEILMAGMTSEQLTILASYQARAEAFRQAEIQRLVEKALDDAGLCKRDVTPFMRVRVVGLHSLSYEKEECLREGIITIWSPTYEQQFELAEGKAYVVSELTPLNSERDELYLHAKGSKSRWQPLPPSALEKFKPFYCPRKAVSLSDLGSVPLAREFDTVVLVVLVGEAYDAGQRKRQWVFVTDGSTSKAEGEEESSTSLLAINFCLPCIDGLPFAPIGRKTGGSIAGFTDVIKRPKDIINHMWVAEGTIYSNHFLSFNGPRASHLKNAAASVGKWAKISHAAVETCRRRVLFMTGNYEGSGDGGAY